MLAVVPGLGHAYLRVWGRAALWFSAAVLTASLLIPPEIYAAIEGFGDLPAAWGSISPEAALGIALVTLFNVVDAYWTGKRLAVPDDETRCPTCGRTVDEELSFCHWCTADLSVEA